jgi:hypothetical protein
MRPSTPSSTAATITAAVAGSKRSSSAKRIAVIPAQSASSVRILGISRLSDSPAMGLTRSRPRPRFSAI